MHRRFDLPSFATVALSAGIRPYARAALAGPGAAIVTLLMVMGLGAVLPPGPGGVDGIALPLVLLPLIWAALFFHACLDRSLRRAALVAAGLGLAAMLAVALHRASAGALTPTGSLP